MLPYRKPTLICLSCRTMQPTPDLQDLANKLSSPDYWGAYFKNQYYFRINTRRYRHEVNLQHGDVQLPEPIQRQLQDENLPALFHEFLHYLHEVSTVIGNASMGLSLTMKACFTSWLDRDLNSARSEGMAAANVRIDEYAKAWTTMSVIDGTDQQVISGKMDGVLGYQLITQPTEFSSDQGYQLMPIEVPKIKFIDRYQGLEYHHELFFGKFYLYEGLAYELDRIVDKQYYKRKSINDVYKMTEYTVLRQFAKHLFKNITKESYLSLAVMSLQYLNSGEMFIILAKEVKENAAKGIDQKTSIKNIKARVSALLIESRAAFFEAQDEYVILYAGRPELQQAFRFITEENKRLYQERIKNPCFEIDLIFTGNFRDLLDKLQICDYMYEFKDDDKYMRDFLGTTLDEETSQALKALIAYDDYYYRHNGLSTEKVEQQSHECPFFTCCHLQQRTDHADICAKTPWRIFEISQQTDKRFCWYGSGVGQAKSQVAPKP